MRANIRLLSGAALLLGSLRLAPEARAHEWGLEYATEWQTDFKGGYNWVNLLRLSGSVEAASFLKFDAATISIARTAQQPLIDDLQGFSNIEEDATPLAIALLGAEVNWRRSTFFLGIRNVGEDFFTTPLTSLFLNSSCGIFPTIAANYDIANYPLASWCFHYRVEWERWTLQSSLYEGLGHRQIAGRDNVFRFKPSDDGVFSITSAEFTNNGSNYSLGLALYYGMHPRDDLPAETSAAAKKVSVAPWANVEQRITDSLSVMAQASMSTALTNCRYYFGLGGAYEFKRHSSADKAPIRLGLFADYANFVGADEWVAELTAEIPLTRHLTFQPTIELITTGGNFRPISLLRLHLTL